MPFTPEELEAMRLADEKIDREFAERYVADQVDKEISAWLDELAYLESLDHKAAAKFKRQKKYSAAYRAEHKEEIAAYQAAYRAEHKEEIAAKKAAYYAEHKEEIAAYQAAYRAEHKEEIAAYQAAYRAEPENRRRHNEYMREYMRAYRKGIRRKANDAARHVCAATESTRKEPPHDQPRTPPRL